MAAQSPAEKVVAVAKSWVGRDFHPGESAQCAPFVRHVFAEAGVPVASAAHPSDQHLLFATDGLSPNFADSFAGDDVGRKVTLAEARPGDIVMFKNTYGDWNDGVITHVGIYTGNNLMVDRSTSAHPVDERSVYTFSGGPCEIRRPKALDYPHTRVELEHGKVSATVRGSKSFGTDVKVQIKGAFGAWIDNAPVQAKTAHMKIHEKGTGRWYKLSMENGTARASVNNAAVAQINCRFHLQAGALHVWVDGKELKADEAAVEIVHKS